MITNSPTDADDILKGMTIFEWIEASHFERDVVCNYLSAQYKAKPELTQERIRDVVWWESFVEGHASYWAGTDTKSAVIHCFQKDNTLRAGRGRGIPTVFIPHKFLDKWNNFLDNCYRRKHWPDWEMVLEIARRQEKKGKKEEEEGATKGEEGAARQGKV